MRAGAPSAAKQYTHRPGPAPAPGLRARGGPVIVSQTASSQERNHEAPPSPSPGGLSAVDRTDCGSRAPPPHAPQEVNISGWGLAEFIEHLHHRGIQLRVISTRSDGVLDENVYLTENPDESWLSFQRKVKGPEQIDQWRGSVYVERNPAYGDELLSQWGEHGCRIGDFMLFGDRQLSQRIQRA